jgi:Reverse transcriptase (RNA-dependent DNA polymerase)
VNFILDADIRSFFTEVSQEWVVRFLEHRIGPRSGPMQRQAVSALGDQRILRLIQKWLRAGVLEAEVVTIEEKGTGQGSVISPLLANVYLHYVFDLWAVRWRRREATGDMIMVRYADDIVVGFQHEDEARRFWDCQHCSNWTALDLSALIHAGHGDTPLLDLPLRCRQCGRRGHEVVASYQGRASPGVDALTGDGHFAPAAPGSGVRAIAPADEPGFVPGFIHAGAQRPASSRHEQKKADDALSARDARAISLSRHHERACFRTGPAR